MIIKRIRHLLTESRGVSLTEVLAAMMILLLVFTAASKSVSQMQQKISQGRLYEVLSMNANEEAVKGQNPLTEKKTTVTFKIGKNRCTVSVLQKEYGTKSETDDNILKFPVILKTIAPAEAPVETD